MQILSLVINKIRFKGKNEIKNEFEYRKLFKYQSLLKILKN